MYKGIILVIGVLINLSAKAQWVSYEISPKGDTLNCVDKENLKQGRWVVKVSELRGEPGYEEEGIFKDDKKEGVWRKYNLTGDLMAIENFKWGNRDGKQQYFTMLGDLLREESWRAINPDNPYDTVDVPDLYDPNKIETKVIKHESNAVKHGTWKFYDPATGLIVKTEKFFFGKPDNGNAKTTTEEVATESKPVNKPKEVVEYEKKNSGKKKVKVRDGRTGG
jgi:hypothetical protein